MTKYNIKKMHNDLTNYGEFIVSQQIMSTIKSMGLIEIVVTPSKQRIISE